MKPLSGVGGQAEVSKLGNVQPAKVEKTETSPPGEKKVGDDFRAGRVENQRQVPTSRIHFSVHPGMEELKAYAREQGWTAKGFTNLSVPWQELVYTTDNWKTTLSLKSTDVPSPIVNGFFSLPNVPKGTTVEFAIHVGVASHAPSDIAGYRERGELWLNNGGKNYSQVSQ
jgi:hypothetical protein